MPLFKYKVIDAFGNNQKGNLEGINKHEVVQKLQEKDYFILDIQVTDKTKDFF